MKLSEIISILGAEAAGAVADGEPLGYSIDSRTVRPGDLFFAIKGEVHDGHNFVADVLGKGALAAVVQKKSGVTRKSEVESLESGVLDFTGSASGESLEGEHKKEAEGVRLANSRLQTLDSRLLLVDDTLAALQRLASAVVKNWRGQLVAVTGSAGKTTTKDLLAAVLATAGRVIKTQGNFNNAYGLPLSVLKMESDGARAADFDYGVFEMGMNHAGELTELTRIAPPDVAVVTNVSAAHLEFFASVDAIADAKAELVAGVKARGAAVLNADDARVARMRDLRDDLTIRTFGIEQAADVSARDINADSLRGTRFTLVTRRGAVAAHLPLVGRHNLYNALAAAAVAELYDAPLAAIATALAGVQAPKMRGEVVRLPAGFTVIDDSYNSNPRALVEMTKAVALAEGFQRRLIVAGEMLELGEAGAQLHREAGAQIAAFGVDCLVGVRGMAEEIIAGAVSAGMAQAAARFFATPEEAAEFLAGEARAGDLILVKGSRGVKTEVVVQRLKKSLVPSP